MGEEIVKIVLDEPLSGGTGFDEAVQRVVDARIAEFAAAMMKAILPYGDIRPVLLEELRKWAQPVSAPACDKCGTPFEDALTAVCQRCNGAGTEPHSSLIPCPICKGASPKAASPPISQPSPLSQCCSASTFVEDNQRRVCKKCGCTRPL